MEDGDIYFWRWKSHEDRFMPYHCKAQKAVARNGRLIDTFWGSYSDSYVLDLAEVNVEYQGNVNEMRAIPEYQLHYYRSEDVVDMRHSNNSGAAIYVKPGATRNADVMMDYLRSQIEQAESDIRIAQNRIERLQEALKSVANGHLEEVHD